VGWFLTQSPQRTTKCTKGIGRRFAVPRGVVGVGWFLTQSPQRTTKCTKGGRRTNIVIKEFNLYSCFVKNDFD
ncbi:MAG: hypothetical protein ACOYK9_06075, partial [Chlamydiia bacterium]